MTTTNSMSSLFLPDPDLVSDEKLQQAIVFAQTLLNENKLALASSMEGLSDLTLPDFSSNNRDFSALKPLAPLYLSFELEQAKLLVTADKIAGLYTSGAINQSLGDAEKHIMAFWSNRHKRLDQQERVNILEQAFEARVFYPQFLRLCKALVALADNGSGNSTGRDLQEEVSVDILLQQLRDYFFSRPLGMISYAAEDILSSITKALAFMKDQLLLTAFGVRSLWDLLTITGENTTYQNRQHAEMASAGMIILNWLASPDSGQLQFNNPAQTHRLISAAHRWVLAYTTLASYSNSANSRSTNSNSTNSYSANSNSANSGTTNSNRDLTQTTRSWRL